MAERRTGRRFWLITAAILAVVFGGGAFALSRHLVQTQLDEYSQRLQLLSSLRKQALDNYLDTARAEITFWSTNARLLDFQRRLVAYWARAQAAGRDPSATLRHLYLQHDGQASDKPAAPADDGYGRIHDRLHPLARRFVTERGYYDLFLISPEGDVVYTVMKEPDFATNLRTGPWRNTGLAQVFKRAVDGRDHGTVAFSDFESYQPSNGDPAMFMARALTGVDGKLLGVFALQLPTDRINAIMNFTAGMGETGETYVVGEDLLMRSNSRFSRESTILRVKVDTIPVHRALEGRSGTVFTRDYRGEEVLSAYTHLDIDGFRWAVLAEIDRREVMDTLAGKRSLIGGSALFMFTLGLWSFWYVRPGDWSADELLNTALAPDGIDHHDHDMNT